MCYEKAVPIFAEEELIRLYGSVFSSLTHLKLYPSFKSVSTYVVRDGKQIKTLLLFRKIEDRVQVLNEVVELQAEEIDGFLRYVFSTYKSVNTVSFHAIAAPHLYLQWPLQRYTCSEDIAVRLPSNQADYFASLGKSSRQYINRYLNRLRREEPSFSFEVLERHEIEEGLVRKVIELNRARMREKQTFSVIDEDETRRIVERVKAYGMVGVISLRGEVVAGTINYHVGKDFFLELIAHDPAYNHLRLGTLCCYMTICESIRRGGEQYHFLWGQSDYKYRLGGVERNLDHVEVYRSRLQYFLHSGRVLQAAMHDRARRMRRRIHHAEQEGARWAGPALTACNLMRRMKAWATALMTRSPKRA